MMQSIWNATSLPSLEHTAVFAQRRHEVLAGNVANLDTPGYVARDLPVDQFQQSLARAIRQQTTTETSPGMSPGMSSGAGADPYVEPRQVMQTVLRHDDGAVSLEHQVTELAKNQQMHSLAIALMRSQFSTLNAAISERV